MTATVASDGAFRFPDVHAGTYEVRPKIEGFVTDGPTILQLAMGQRITLQPITLVVDAATEARGTLRGSAHRQDAPAGAHGGIVVRFRGRPGATVTASDGTYEEDVPAGVYTLVFEAPGYGTEEVADLRVTQGEPTDVPPIELVGRPGTLRGTVAPPSGFAWSAFRQDVVVELWSTSADPAPSEAEATLQPDTDGNFEFEVRAGTWRLVARKPAYDDVVWPRLSVAPGDTTDAGLGRFDSAQGAGGDVRLPAVTGTATRSPLPPGEDHAGTWVEVPGTPYTTVTDADGRYLVNVPVGVPPTLRFRHTGYTPVTLALPDGPAEGEVLEAEPVTLEAGLGAVRGHVTFPEGFVDPPVEHVDAVLSPLDGAGDASMPLPAVHPDATGDFTVRDVMPGNWRLDLTVAGFTTPAFTLVPVGVGETVNVGTAVFAQTADDRGAAYVEGDVTLLGVDDPEGHGGSLIEVRGTPFTALTNRAGHYRVEVVPELPVALVVTHDGYDDGYDDLAGVAAGETFPARPLELAPRDGTIHGAVTLVGVNDPALYPLVAVQRRAVGAPNDAPPADQVPPDVEGRFVFAQTPVGRWRLSAQLAGFTASPGPEVEVVAGGRVDAAPILLSAPNGDPVDPGAPAAPVVTGRVQLTGAAAPDAHGGVLVEVIGTALAATTTSEGRFQISVLPAPARPSLRFRKEGYGAATLDLEPQALGARTTLPDDVVLTALPGRVTGTVRLGHFGDALRLQAVDVVASLSRRAVAQTRPDAAGAFVLPDLPAGEYVFNASLAGYDRSVRNVQVEPGRVVDLGEVLLTHQSDGDAAVALEGTVTLAGRAEHGGTLVQVRLVDGDLPFREALTRVDGRFSVSASREERYRLIFDHPGFDPPPAGFGPVSWDPPEARFEDEAGRVPGLQLTAAPLAGLITVPVAFGPDWVPGRELLAARVELTGPDFREVVDGVTAVSPAVFNVPRAGSYVVRASRAGFVDSEVAPVFVTADAPIARSEVIQLALQRLADADLNLSTLDACHLRNGVDARGAVLDGATLVGDFGATEPRCGPVANAGPLDLNRASLVGADLVGARFATAAGASRVVLRETLLRDVTAAGVDFRFADLSGSDLRGANFERTTLSGARLDGTRMGQVDLSEAVIGDAQRGPEDAVVREPAESPWAGRIAPEHALPAAPCTAGNGATVSFEDADLGEANFTAAFLAAVDLRGASLPRAVFDDTDLRGACLQNANLDGSSMTGTLLDGADARQVSLAQARLERARLRGTWLDGARFGGAQVSGCDFTEFPTIDCLTPLTWDEYDVNCVADPTADPRCRCSTRLRDAALDGAVFLGTSLRGVDATGVSGNGWTLGPGTVLGLVQPPLCTPEKYFECRALQEVDTECRFFLSGSSEGYDEICSFGDPMIPFSVLGFLGSRTPEEARERVRCMLRGRAAGATCGGLGPCFGQEPAMAFGGDDGAAFGNCSWPEVEGMALGTVGSDSACQLSGTAIIDSDCKPTSELSRSRFDAADLPFFRLDRGYLSNLRFWHANLTAFTVIDDLLYVSDPDVRWHDLDMSEATLSRAVFSRVGIGGLTFTGADLSGVLIEQSLVQGLAWRPARDDGAMVVESYLMCTDGFDCTSQGTADIVDSYIQDDVIDVQRMTGGVLTSRGAIDFTEVVGTQVHAETINGTTATSARLTAPRVQVAQIRDSIVSTPQMMGGNLDTSSIGRATWTTAPARAVSSRLDGSVISQKCATGRDYSRSSFRGANFSGSKVSRTLFLASDLTNADFTDACGISARPTAFDGAIVQGTRFCSDERAAFEAGNRVSGTPQWVACTAGRTCQANCN
jgi:uncharacterized protein YjbI with pentapeptide repeats